MTVALDLSGITITTIAAVATEVTQADQFGLFVADDLGLSLSDQDLGLGLGDHDLGLFVNVLRGARVQLDVSGVLFAVGSGLVGVDGGAEAVSVSNVLHDSLATVFVSQFVRTGSPAFAALLPSGSSTGMVLFIVTELVVAVSLNSIIVLEG